MDEVKRQNNAVEELCKKRDEWTKSQREFLKREQKSVGDFKDVSYIIPRPKSKDKKCKILQ